MEDIVEAVWHSKFSVGFHPQTDGQIEVVNRSLDKLLRCFVSEKPNVWDLVLPTAKFAYNNVVNMSTKRSPVEVVHGAVPRLPIDLVSLPIDSQPVEFVENFAKHHIISYI